MRKLSTAFFIFLGTLIVFAIWAERAYPVFWQEPLLFKDLYEPTPPPGQQFNAGTILPSVIENDLTLTTADNPIILNGLVKVSNNATLTIQQGVRLFANKFSTIQIEGSLIITGTTDHPVFLATNESYPDHQTWNGIVVAKNAVATIKNVQISEASPAITCRPESIVEISNSILQTGSLGVFTESKSCVISNSIIRGFRDGITAIGVEPEIIETNIHVTHTDIIEKEIITK